MKIKKTFLIHESEGETMLVPAGGAGFSGLVRGNRTFGEILKLLQNGKTEDEMIEALMEKYPGAEENIQADVHRAIESLRKIGALEES